MQTVLILGAKGMMGRELQDYLTGSYDIYIDDRDTLDITNNKVLFKRIKEVQPDVVINCAAVNDIEQAEHSLEETMQVNGYSVEHMAKICEQFQAIFIQFSTDCVFDGEKNDPYHEDSAKYPLSVFGKSKSLGEDLALNYCTRTYIIRSSWMYGTYGDNFVKKLLERTKTAESLRAIADQYGTPTWARDICIKVKELIENQDPYGVYHFVNEGSASWYEFARTIFQLKDINLPIAPVSYTEAEEKNSRPKYSVLSNTKTEPMRHWEEALGEYLRVF